MTDDREWNVEQNRSLRETTGTRRLCWLEGCELELDAGQRKYCSRYHGDAARARRSREAKRSRQSLSRHTFGEELIADDAARHRRRHCASGPIVPMECGGRPGQPAWRPDRDRVFDRVTVNHGRAADVIEVLPLRTKPSGVTLSGAQRRALDGVVCRHCQRFAIDCATLTEHLAMTIRIVAVDDRSTSGLLCKQQSSPLALTQGALAAVG